MVMKQVKCTNPSKKLQKASICNQVVLVYDDVDNHTYGADWYHNMYKQGPPRLGVTGTRIKWGFGKKSSKNRFCHFHAGFNSEVRKHQMLGRIAFSLVCLSQFGLSHKSAGRSRTFKNNLLAKKGKNHSKLCPSSINILGKHFFNESGTYLFESYLPTVHYHMVESKNQNLSLRSLGQCLQCCLLKKLCWVRMQMFIVMSDFRRSAIVSRASSFLLRAPSIRFIWPN